MSLFSSLVWCLSFPFHILISLISPCGSPSSFIFQKRFRAMRDSFFLILFILSFLPLFSLVLHSSVFSPFLSHAQAALLPPSLPDFYSLFWHICIFLRSFILYPHTAGNCMIQQPDWLHYFSSEPTTQTHNRSNIDLWPRIVWLCFQV
jgi:hypothetical protein